MSDPLSNSDSSKIEEAFSRAVELHASERDEFLSSLPTHIEKRVKSLLLALDNAGDDFLDPIASSDSGSPSGSVSNDPQKGGNLRPSFESNPKSVDSVFEQQSVGDGIGEIRIPGFELLRKIGTGGMGRVFLAKQAAPIERSVAIKLINDSFISSGFLTRFQAEQKTNALMDHPNIARVIYAGSDSRGCPFLAMEFVDGIDICRYCDQAGLAIAERLDVFFQLCEAIQHAHIKGVIHRDIKPSNVLVTEVDGKPTVKVIDFGVSKSFAVDDSEVNRESLTEQGQVIGSMRYMSPEQAAGLSIKVDTRSDVYSLGVLLFELLTGTTPIPRERFRTDTPDELLRAIREEEVVRPSQRVRSSEMPSENFLKTRRVSKHELSSLLETELDWITLKALEIDAAARYQSPLALAEDVKRYLDNDVVQATPPSTLYRLRKFAKLHRRAILVAASFLGLLLIATVVSSGLAVWATNEAKQARLAETSARLAQKESSRLALEEKKQRQRAGDLNRDLKAKTRELLTTTLIGYRVLEASFSAEESSLLSLLDEINAQNSDGVTSTNETEARVILLKAVYPLMQILRSQSELKQPPVQNDANLFQKTFGIGTQLFKLGAFNSQVLECQRLLDSAIDMDPSLGLAYLTRAQLSTELYPWMTDPALTAGLKKPNEGDVTADWDQAVKLLPDASYSHSGRGWWLKQLKRYEEAEVDFREAVTLDPGNELAQEGLADMLYLRDQNELARDHYLRAYRSKGGMAQILFQASKQDFLSEKIAAVSYRELWDNRQAASINKIRSSAFVHIFGEDTADYHKYQGFVWDYVLNAMEQEQPDWLALPNELEQIDIPEGEESYATTLRLLRTLLTVFSGLETEEAAEKLCDSILPPVGLPWRGELDEDQIHQLGEIARQQLKEDSRSLAAVDRLLDRLRGL